MERDIPFSSSQWKAKFSPILRKTCQVVFLRDSSWQRKTYFTNNKDDYRESTRTFVRAEEACPFNMQCTNLMIRSDFHCFQTNNLVSFPISSAPRPVDPVLLPNTVQTRYYSIKFNVLNLVDEKPRQGEKKRQNHVSTIKRIQTRYHCFHRRHCNTVRTRVELFYKVSAKKERTSA